MTFPSAALGARCELNLDGWTDISPFAVQQGHIATTITRGRQDETATVMASSAPMRWNNRGAQFDPDNPTGPFYGLLGLNTPVRWSIPGPGAALRLEDDQVSYASTGPLTIPGNLDARIDFQPSGYYPAVLFHLGGTCSLYLDNDGTLRFVWADSSNGLHSATSAGAPPVPLGRVALRVTLNISTGAVTFYTAPNMGGTFTQLAQVAGAGATTLHANTGLAVGGQSNGGAPYANTAVTGRIFEFQAYNGIGGTLIADPQFYAQTPGTTSFADGQGNTWVLQGSATIDSRSYRFHGEASSLPEEWDPAGADIWVPCSASGILRRLQQGNTPVVSTYRRFVTSLTGNKTPAAYWPGEDAAGASVIASGLPGGTPMTFGSPPGFQGTAGSPSADSEFVCSASLPQINGTTWSGPVATPAGFTWTDNVTRFLLYEQAGSVPDTTVLARVQTTGKVARVDLQYGVLDNGSLNLTGYDRGNNQLFTTNYVTFGIDGQPLQVSMDLIRSGANITCQVQIIAPGANVAESFSVTLTSAAPGAVTRVIVNPGGAALGSTILGQITVQGTWGTLGGTEFGPLNAWNGEPAGMRFGRLCTENNINNRVYGIPAATAAMGFQPIDTLANLLQQVEDCDRGQLYEPRQCLGLGYRTLASLQNQAAAVQLAYNLGEVSPPLKPTRDDRLVRNDVTLTRNNGSSAQVQVTSGPLSVQDPPAGAGDYNTSLTVYCESDGQLPNIAGWMTWTGTAPEKRYPQLTVDLASKDANMQAVLAAVRDSDIGDHIQVTGTPQPLLPPGNIDQLAWGSTETLGDFVWKITWNTVPETPYEVAAAGAANGAGVAHAQTPGTTLTSAVSSSATSLTLTGPAWTQNAGDFPFDIAVAGERCTVSAIAAGSGGIRAGVFLNPSAMGLASWSAAQALWTTWTGDTAKVTRVYLGNASSWSISADMTAMISAGVKLLISVQPAYNPVSSSDRAALVTFCQALQTAGATCDFCVWSEPFFGGLTSAQYIAAAQYYGPAIRTYFPLVFVTSTASVTSNSENTYYPGDAWVDKVATDYYAGSPSVGWDDLPLAAAPADAAVPAKPFGLWEFNGSPASTGQSQSAVTSFVTYITGYFQGRVANGQPITDVCMFSGAPGANFMGCSTTQAAGFEGGIANWTPAGNSTIAGSSAWAHSGSGSLALTAQAAGSQVQAASCTAASILTQGMPVTAGQVVDLAGWFRGASTAKAVQVGIQWFNASGTSISTVYGSTVTDAASGTGVQAVARGLTAPAGTAFARGLGQVDATVTLGEVHYLDDFEMRIVSGSNPANVTTVEFGWDYRIALWQSVYAALNNAGAPQLMTVTRSVNGVVKAQAAGTAISLYHVPVAALAGVS